MARQPRDHRKYHLKGPDNTIIRSGISKRPLSIREREHQRDVAPRGRIEQVGRATTEEAARAWEKRQRKGTPAGGR